jgi:hypothetical protein
VGAATLHGGAVGRIFDCGVRRGHVNRSEKHTVGSSVPVMADPRFRETGRVAAGSLLMSLAIDTDLLNAAAMTS